MEIEKPVTLEDKIAAARERRERLQKEREAARQETVNRAETAARRKSQIQAQTETERKQRRDSLSSRHDEAKERREVILRQKKEKALSDLEKGEARSREAQKKKRWSWNGAVHGTWWYNFPSETIAEGTEPDENCGGDDGSRARPTAMPRSMQSWIGSLRGGFDQDDNDSLNGSTLGTPRDCKSQNSSFSVPDRLLTPTASSRAKRFGKPDGQTSSPPSLNGDSSLKEAKLRRRTISHEHLNRLAQPRVRTVSSERHSLDPKPKPSGRTTPQPRSRNTSRDSSNVISSSSLRPKPDGSETPSLSKTSSKTPDAKKPAREVKPRSASVTPRHPRTSGVGASSSAKKDESTARPSPRQQKTTTTPKPKSATAAVKPSPKPSKSAKPSAKNSSDGKKTESPSPPPVVKKSPSPPPAPEEAKPVAQAEVVESAPVAVEPTKESDAAALENQEKPASPMSVNPLDVPLPDDDEEEGEAAAASDASRGEKSASPVQDLEKDNEEEKSVPASAAEINNENPSIQSLKESSAVSLVSSSATSLHSDISTEATESEQLHIQASLNDDDRLQKTVSFDDTVEVSEIPAKVGPTEEEIADAQAKEDKKLKKKKKKEKKEKKEKKKREEKAKNSMLESWLNDSHSADLAPQASPEPQEREVSPPDLKAPEKSEEQNNAAQNSVIEAASEQEDEYKRRLREKKEKFRQEQAAKEAKQKADEENRKRLADEAAAARLAKEQEEAKKLEEEKEQLANRISENVRRADQEREEKRQAEEKERLARKKRIEEIMKRTRGSENSFPSSSQINERISQRQNGSAASNGEQTHDDVGARARSLLGSFQNLRMGGNPSSPVSSISPSINSQPASSVPTPTNPEQINAEGS
ncbi:Oidioi.mRNA.OKI2018_I69.chr1.g3811.t1.cds [Oikopleura dioica]|uniref:Oidioi.mRNA.OKI2018_I69.chr1.g3811.t1.cds n=1 Tax=Oikopleura dioica TaxID=34765 RepID=A0ABN7SZK8_OIKDI|nr:Oidioi.mRNA.OKI2018_I69.chr1.g3811.t1.cds [Oikopleura dioica]